jgi:hypothetical protein
VTVALCGRDRYPSSPQIRQNEAVIAEKMADDSEPMSYYRAFKDVVSVLPRDAVIVSLATSRWPFPLR